MKELLIIIFTIASLACFWQFLRNFKLSPLWLMLSAWFISIAISELHLSSLELPWPGKYWLLIFVSLASFALGVWVFDKVWRRYRWWQKCKLLLRNNLSVRNLRIVIYILFLVSLGALYLFYKKSGNFPILASDPDQFRFIADTQVPGLINYLAQLSRVFIPLAFFLMFYQEFNWRKHWDLVLICLIGTGCIILFVSRTQIFFIDLWVMGLYLLMRKPNLKQALKFYPFFLLVSLVVLAAVPLIRQYRSYGSDYLGMITGIDTSGNNKIEKALLPIYIGVSFNQQALLHAELYYQTHPVQHGKVSLDPFTNIFGKVIKPLQKLKSNYDLGAIFYSWWNTGTYLFPFVQDFGISAFYFVPFLIAGLLTLAWHYWKTSPNFLSLNFYAYALFFIVFSVYMSFTVRAELYLDIALLFVSYLYVSRYES
ncbi:MAG: O-antigen polymerase [Candidatus Doudnabacteria bacterium]